MKNEKQSQLHQKGDILMRLLKKDLFLKRSTQTFSNKNFCHWRRVSCSSPSNSEEKSTFQGDLEREDKENYQNKLRWGVSPDW